jgi:membrane protein DedA with SNARE-associated domain
MHSLEKNDPIAPGRLRYDPDTLLAVTWGLAEATLFFIVPDVLLTRIAILRGWRQALRACGWALAGAIVGIALVYYAAATGHSTGLTRWFDWIPGISPSLMAQVHDNLEDHGVGVVWRGAFTGVPFKVYALHAGAMHIGWMMFLLTSLVACLARFAAACLLAWVLAKTVLRFCSRAYLQAIHVAVWVTLYAVYFIRLERLGCGSCCSGGL